MKNKKTHKIQSYNKWYSILRHYVDFSLFNAYRKIEYYNLDKIPTDGAIIYAPNHTNALMDALVVLSMDKKPKVFVARADIFKNPKIAKILTFLKIMPIRRIRDGLEEVKKNDETIEKAVEVLSDDIPFCILPEGTHRAQHSLLPLLKGIFRIALVAQEHITEKPVYIVPLGLEYGNFFRFRSTVLAQVGDPINMSEFIATHKDLTHPEMMNVLKAELTHKMKDTIIYIPDDDNYEYEHEICAVLINKQLDKIIAENKKEKRLSLTTRFNANKKTISQIEELKKQSPEKAEILFGKAKQIYQERVKNDISLSSVVINNPFWSRIIKSLLIIITLPYTIPATIFALPISIIARLIFTKIKDTAFYNSIRYVITLALWPILMIIYSILAIVFLDGIIAICAIAAILPANLVAQDVFRLLRLIISDTKLLLNPKLRKDIKDLQKLFSDYTQ